MAEYNPMTDYYPRQDYNYTGTPYSNDFIASRERDETTARCLLSQIGFRLMRSDNNPDTINVPAYKIISASRLTFNEILQFLQTNLPMKS